MDLLDPETCSRCLTEVEWDDLTHVLETGENVCDDCLDQIVAEQA